MLFETKTKSTQKQNQAGNRFVPVIEQIISYLNSNPNLIPTHKKIKKRSGGYRNIYIPNDEHKAALRKFIKVLRSKNFLSDQLTKSTRDVRNVVPITGMANSFLVKIDLKNAFESIDASNAIQLVKAHLLSKFIGSLDISGIINHPNFTDFVSYNNIVPIGYPTSNILFEVSMTEIDSIFNKIVIPDRFIKYTIENISIRREKIKLPYFRYVDDLIFVIPKESIKVIGVIKNIIEEHGLSINKHKIQVINGKSGWKIFSFSIHNNHQIYPTFTIPKKVRNLVKTLVYQMKKHAEDNLIVNELTARIAGILGYYWPRVKPASIINMAKIYVRNW